MSDSKIKIGITHGDYNGIGYEVILKALADPAMTELCTPVIYGSEKALAFYRKLTPSAADLNVHPIAHASEASPKRINLINCLRGELQIEPGVTATAAGQGAVAALEAAAEELKAGAIDAVVTAPICKETVQSDRFNFTGHTEFFAARFGGNPLMLMCSEGLKVGLVTIHIPVSAVSESITRERILEALRKLRKSLISDFGVHEPRIAVLALNPHGGDGGLIGREELEVIAPAIRAAAEERILAFGPFAADGFFAAETRSQYDAVLAMYHDQGLAPFKALAQGGVNFTAGLPVVRTSPAHGVGFDIAGQDRADERAMREAIFTAIDIVRSRRRHAEMTRNPLQKFKREHGADVSVLDLPEQEPQD